MPRLQRWIRAGLLLGRHGPFVLPKSGTVCGDHSVRSGGVMRRGLLQGTREPDEGLCHLRQPPGLNLCNPCRGQISVCNSHWEWNWSHDADIDVSCLQALHPADSCLSVPLPCALHVKICFNT